MSASLLTLLIWLDWFSMFAIKFFELFDVSLKQLRSSQLEGRCETLVCLSERHSQFVNLGLDEEIFHALEGLQGLLLSAELADDPVSNLLLVRAFQHASVVREEVLTRDLGALLVGARPPALGKHVVRSGLSRRNDNSKHERLERVTINPDLTNVGSFLVGLLNERKHKNKQREEKNKSAKVLFPLFFLSRFSFLGFLVTSILSTAIYSPWDSLNIFFFLSMILRVPFGLNLPTSPVCNQPSMMVL
jgi:hypothetical protein